MHRIAIAIAALIGVFIALPAWAQSEIVITQAKALAGNVTPGDTAGYPVTLSQPGAYILGSNLSVTANQYGIIPLTNNVDIDLNGFRIYGGNVAYSALVAGYGQSRIHGGVVSQFRGSGLYIRSEAWTIDDMRIMNNAALGIDAGDQNRIVVQNSTLLTNGPIGIRARDDCTVRNSNITGHTNIGIYINGTGLVEGNNISENARGLFIIGGLVTGNAFSRNTSYAIEDGNSVTSVTNNSLYMNNPSGTEQIYGAINVYGNTCVGKAC